METQLLISSYDIYTTYQVLKNRATDAAVKLTQDKKINMLPSYFIFIFFYYFWFFAHK